MSCGSKGSSRNMLRDSACRGGFLEGKAEKESQFNDAVQPGIECGELVKRGVEIEDVNVGSWRSPERHWRGWINTLGRCRCDDLSCADDWEHRRARTGRTIRRNSDLESLQIQSHDRSGGLGAREGRV